MSHANRREFLKLSTAATVCLPFWKSFASVSSGAQAWTTSATQKFAPLKLDHSGSASGMASIEIDSTQHAQEILGFGAAFTDASCYLLSQMSEQQRNALLSEFFGPTGLRLSVCRTCIGASDYSRSVYSFDDSSEPDPTLSHFSIEHDKAYILPSIRSASALNPGLFLFSTPWSPPGWMKAGGSMLGGSMRKKYFAAYADYFVKFLQGYAAEGIKIDAITVQNEVDTDQDGRMPAALWGQEYEIGFVKEYLGPALKRASLDTKIWILDHNYNLAGRANDELSDPALNQYVDGVAWHGYVGSPDAMTRIHHAFPEKHAYWTEGGPDISSPDYATDWVKWSQVFTAVLRNWSRCIVGWNLLLDEKGEPNIGPFPCGGLVTIHSKTHELLRSGQYWAMAHYSKTIQRGARVIASQGEIAGIDHVAFENPDGKHVLVLTNKGDQRQVQFGQSSADKITATLEPGSITTVVW